MKKVSVVIPAYNKADLTIKTVESVLAQSYPNIEVIVVDDGSTDSTKEKLTPYKDKIRYVYKDNGGACSARNLGLQLAIGEYIAFLDCDDLYLPRKIESSVDYLEKNSDFGFVHTAAYFIDDDDRALRTFSNRMSRRIGWIAKALLLRNFICSSTVVARKLCFEKVGFFDESIFTPADWDMWMRIAEHYKAGYIDKPLTKYRVSDSYILKHIELWKKEELIVLEKAFKRNPKLDKHLKNIVASNTFCRCAVSYLLTGDFQEAKSELVLALTRNKFNLRAMLLYTVLNISPKNLQRLVKKKVIYNFGH